MTELEPAALDRLFRHARSCNEWTDREVSEETIRSLYDLLKLGPTSANSCPARMVWVRTPAGRAQLASVASVGNRPKLLSAPLVAIIGHDLSFADALPKLLPADRAQTMQEMFKNSALAEVTAMRNGSLQGAYLIMAARALGLDCGPMSGFDQQAVDSLFFAGTNIKSNFLCCLGYGKEPPFSRNPRLSFEDAGRFA